MQNMFTDIDDLLCYLRNNTAVNYINVNSTMGRHYGRFKTKPNEEQILLSGACKGKALIICNRLHLANWQFEHKHACHVMEQLGLQVQLIVFASCPQP